MEKDTKETLTVLWFSRVFRWLLGALFITAGIIYFNEGGWPAILFGTLILVTGFFRPRRCLDDGAGCSLPSEKDAL